MLADDVFDCALGSRILGVGALKGGMPVHKYIANRLLTLLQNLLVGYKLSEYHTGYRAFSRKILTSLPLELNSNDFIFDNQMLLQIIASGFTIGEVTCPTRYTADASSIAGWPVIRYGWGVLVESVKYRLTKCGMMKSIYSPQLITPRADHQHDVSLNWRLVNCSESKPMKNMIAPVRTNSEVPLVNL